MSDSPLQAWNHLVNAAILGTGRGIAFDLPQGGALGDFCRALPSDKIDARLLHGAGALSLYLAMGARPAVQPCFPCKPAEIQDAPPCSSRAGSCLLRVIGSGAIELLVDWCRAASRCGRRAPDESLPALLTLLAGSLHEDWADDLRAVLGHRGRWLAACNPDWRLVTSSIDDLAAAWSEMRTPDRVRVLRAIRRIDPARGRALVESVLAHEQAEDRAALIGCLRAGLSMEDEPFLETTLDDASKVVRAATADLLARLPESRFASRMTERALQFVRFERRRKLLGGKELLLEVTLPQCTKEMARDGVENCKHGQLGNRSWILAQIVAGTPLAAWSKTARAEPTDILAAAVRSEWRDALVVGWVMAAERQSDDAWAEALLRAQIEIAAEKRRVLVRTLEAGAREDILAGYLAERTMDPEWRILTSDALLACDHPWSDTLTRCAFDCLGHRLCSVGAANWDPLLKRECTVTIAAHAAPAAAEEAVSAWSEHSESWSTSTKKWADELVGLLELRRAYLKELSP